MTEPIIPSGRDYDENLSPGDRKGERKGLLGRIAAKLRNGRGSKVREFNLRLDPKVATRQATPRVPPPSMLKDAPRPEQPSQPKASAYGTHAQQAGPPSRERAEALRSKPEPAAGIESLLEAQIPGGILGVGAWLLIANPDACNASAVAYLDHLAFTCGDATVASVVRWRLSAAVGDDNVVRRSVMAEISGGPNLPADISAVLRFLAANPMPLATYRRDVALAAVKAASLAELRSFCRDYPSAAPVLLALEAGRLATARQAVDLNSAAWRYGNSIINAAVAAVGAVTASLDPPTCRIPRAWLVGTAAQRCTASALSSIIPDDEKSRLRRRFEPEFTAAVASMPSDLQAEVEVWLSARGVHPVAASESLRRRPLRMSGARSAPQAPQPRQPAGTQARCR